MLRPHKGARTPFGDCDVALRRAIRAAGAADGVDLGAARADHLRKQVESGTIIRPEPADIRKVCLCLGIDPREAAIAQGIITREELKLPPHEPVPPRLRPIVSVVRDPRIPNDAKEDLLHIVDAAVGFLHKQLGIKRPPIEPSADERANAKPVVPR